MIKVKVKIAFNLEGHLYRLRKDRKKAKVFYDGYTFAIGKIEYLRKNKFSEPQMILLKQIIESLRIYMEK